MSMPIGSINPISNPTTIQPAAQPAVDNKVGGKSFSQMLEGLASSDKIQNALGTSLHKELADLQTKVMSGAAVSPKELIGYQIKAQEFGFRLEMISKVAESALGTVRKLQQNQ